ncbi:hypothetical protein LCGC14_1908290 [marine sediment metagenome]|uniref:Uncharacterized protein n=1 Tax=marine sediment metagenome TaxID=412755 RepID=A0A0F9GHN5_9ZZZZ
MGIYKLNFDEVYESMKEWLESLEGDFDVIDIANAFNKVAKKEKWNERLKVMLKKQQEMK